MSNALHSIASYEALHTAWKRLFNEARPKSRDTYGIDKVSLNDFKVNEVANLKQISNELRHGKYTFLGLKPYFIPKPGGKLRLICVPCTRDRIVQGALLNFLSERYTSRFSNAVSYGFLKDRGVKKALLIAQSKRTAKPWVLKTDIKSFFDNIDRVDLKLKLKKVVRETSLHPLLNSIVDAEIVTFTRTERKKVASLEIKQGRGVRQGMPLSPFFSNVVLENFDKATTKAGYSALRYADDLIFFGPNNDFCKEIERFCIRELSRIDLAIPPSGIHGSKTVIYDPTQDADFLGLTISPSGKGYIVKVSDQQIAKIVETFNDLSKVSELVARKLSLGNLGNYLRARKAGFINAYDACTNLASLESQLDDVEQRVLRILYVKELGINLSEISAEAYGFLGLRT
ncbi:reverse transcriptase domain-containing protein [Methylophilus sp. 'Pure River']|uniref:reverse transcriptase domain-containing protein n=1 Tax=Methylophilus sp. 'Pure River' TaxID=3377117 RepID=UPI00398E716F